jgi:hypothetical protein
MGEVNLDAQIALYQTKIKGLDKNNPEDRVKILDYLDKIQKCQDEKLSRALAGKGKEKPGNTELTASKIWGLEVTGTIRDEKDIALKDGYYKNKEKGITAKQAREKIKAENSSYTNRDARREERTNRANAKRWQKVLDTKVCLTKADAENLTAEEKAQYKKIKVVNKKDLELLKKIQKEGYETIEKCNKHADSLVEEAKKSGDAKKIEEAEKQAEAIKKWAKESFTIFGTDEAGNPDYSQLNSRAAQNVFSLYTGWDEKLDLDEKQSLAKATDMKKRQVVHLAKTLGFDHQGRITKENVKDAAIALGIPLATFGIMKIFGLTHAHDHDEGVGETKRVTSVTSTGEMVDTLAKGGAAIADACAKLGVLPFVAAGLAGAAYNLLKEGRTKDIFNGSEALAVLKDPSAADKKVRPKLAQINALELTGNPDTDLAIKAAVLDVARGKGDAVTYAEVSAAYDELLKIKAQLAKAAEGDAPVDDNNGDVVPPNNGDVVPPNNGDGGSTPVPPKTPKIGARATDFELYGKHHVSPVPKTNGADKGKVQLTEGEVSITGNHEAPDSITLVDTTNNKPNTWYWKKLSPEEVAAAKTADGKDLEIPDNIKNSGKPIYILVDITDDQGSQKEDHAAIYQLELEKSDDGESYFYNLNQYKGMSGSGKSEIKWDNRGPKKK